MEEIEMNVLSARRMLIMSERWASMRSSQERCGRWAPMKAIFLWNTFVKTDTRHYEMIGYRRTDFTVCEVKILFAFNCCWRKIMEKNTTWQNRVSRRDLFKEGVQTCRLLSWGFCFLKLAIVNILYGLIFQGTQIYLEEPVSPTASRWLECRKHCQIRSGRWLSIPKSRTTCLKKLWDRTVGLRVFGRYTHVISRHVISGKYSRFSPLQPPLSQRKTTEKGKSVFEFSVVNAFICVDTLWDGVGWVKFSAKV